VALLLLALLRLIDYCYIFFIYLEFFYLYCFLVVIGIIIYKFKEFLKQRIIHSKCQINF